LQATICCKLVLNSANWAGYTAVCFLSEAQQSGLKIRCQEFLTSASKPVVLYFMQKKTAVNTSF